MFETVVIVGRPNVGKSTLFNRLVGKRLAIVDDRPGVTRDWREGIADLAGLKFRIVDTAGLEEAFDDSIQARIRRHTEQIVSDAFLKRSFLKTIFGIHNGSIIFSTRSSGWEGPWDEKE